jgi:diguanylate cyclase (GGDEF)-like protein
VDQNQQQVSHVLSLVQRLTGQISGASSLSELFSSAFRTLHETVPFDVAVSLMLEQHLDLYMLSRSAAESMINDELVRRMRQTLESQIPVPFEGTDVVVKLELADLPDIEGPQTLEHEMHTILKQDNRIAGILLLYRSAPPFDAFERQVLEIFSAQTSMLLGNIRAREQILELADTDDLTGIWNKRYFRRHLPQEFERARVYSLPLSLLMFDVDDFKQINDGFGHTVGDVVLSELCGTVRETLRPPDLFARFGGDEFAIILPHTDLHGAFAVADRIMSRVRRLTIPTDEEGAIQCSISIGIADNAPADETAADLLRRADEQLYAAKREGKNRYAGGVT